MGLGGTLFEHCKFNAFTLCQAIDYVGLQLGV